MQRRHCRRISVPDGGRLARVDHLQQIEPQAPTSLEMAEITPCLPVGWNVMAEDAGALNREEKKPPELGAAEQEFGVGAGEVGEHQANFWP